MMGIEVRDNELPIEQRLVGFILTGPKGDEKQMESWSVGIIKKHCDRPLSEPLFHEALVR